MIANALGPVFLLILFGALLRRINFPGAEFWPGIERLTYYIAFPALLVHRLALADFSNADFGRFALVICAALALTSALTWLLRPWVSRTAADFTSLFQGAIRFNTYIGLAVASALFGDPGLVIAAIAVSIMIPLVNVLCVICFSMVIDGSTRTPGGVLKGLLRNPLIIACVLGVVLNISGVGLGGAWIEGLLARLGSAALPLGLLAVGVALSLGTVKQDWPTIVLASVLKFIVFPGLMLGLAIWWQLDLLSRQVLLLLACLPTATSAYILSRQLGGNAVMMANIISAQTLLAFAVIPLWLLL
ncbi:AEC family transporter [Pseudohongiella sp.]|uniref:Transporter n=1 Tax=marine sediment metagenome TaxID=412755 RepID=A0A0F9W3M2_9ZZZZ|nr:AEC family transporter [Pseudohongiella sp.]HDZ08474.1 AEC family transporter [Pseudohongiella sp.]HEA61788.1 AEC family transporter [Pseudohongiella sp.]